MHSIELKERDFKIITSDAITSVKYIEVPQWADSEKSPNGTQGQSKAQLSQGARYPIHHGDIFEGVVDQRLDN